MPGPGDDALIDGGSAGVSHVTLDTDATVRSLEISTGDALVIGGGFMLTASALNNALGGSLRLDSSGLNILKNGRLGSAVIGTSPGNAGDALLNVPSGSKVRFDHVDVAESGRVDVAGGGLFTGSGADGADGTPGSATTHGGAGEPSPAAGM